MHNCFCGVEQDAPAGWVATRRIRSRGVVDAAGGIRLFKAEVQYTLGPAGGEGLSAEAQAVASEHKSLSTSVVHIYAISAPEDMLAEALSARRADQVGSTRLNLICHDYS